MKRLIVSLFFIFVVLYSVEASVVDYRYKMDIPIEGTHKYKGIRLNQQMLNKLSDNLADIELISNGEDIPYFMNSYTNFSESVNKKYELQKINSFTKNKDMFYDYKLREEQSGDIIASSIEITTGNTNFAKQVEYWGSYDNMNWELINSEALFEVSGSKKLSLALLGGKKYTHYRFKIPNNMEKIDFTSVSLVYSLDRVKKEYFIKSFVPTFETQQIQDKTVLKINQIKNLSIASITIKTEDIFKRQVNFLGAGKMLYNLEFKDTNYKDLTLPLNETVCKDESAEFTIINGSDKPIVISGVEIEYYTSDIIFNGQGIKELEFKFGNESILQQKNYDINNYREFIIEEGYDIIHVDNLILGEDTVEQNKTSTIDYQIILNIVVVLVSFVLIVVIIYGYKHKVRK